MEKVTDKSGLKDFSEFIGKNLAQIKASTFADGRRAGLEEAARLCEDHDCSRIAKKVRTIAQPSNVGLDKPEGLG